MKWLLLILWTPLFSVAQDSAWNHCTIKIIPREFSQKVNVEIDYGQDTHFFDDNRMRFESGNLAKFNSVVDVLNYMSRERWELVTASPMLTNGGPRNLFWIVMLRRKEKLEH